MACPRAKDVTPRQRQAARSSLWLLAALLALHVVARSATGLRGSTMAQPATFASRDASPRPRQGPWRRAASSLAEMFGTLLGGSSSRTPDATENATEQRLERPVALQHEAWPPPPAPMPPLESRIDMHHPALSLQTAPPSFPLTPSSFPMTLHMEEMRRRELESSASAQSPAVPSPRAPPPSPPPPAMPPLPPACSQCVERDTNRKDGNANFVAALVGAVL